MGLDGEGEGDGVSNRILTRAELLRDISDMAEVIGDAHGLTPEQRMRLKLMACAAIGDLPEMGGVSGVSLKPTPMIMMYRDKRVDELDGEELDEAFAWARRQPFSAGTEDIAAAACATPDMKRAYIQSLGEPMRAYYSPVAIRARAEAEVAAMRALAGRA